MKIHLKNHSPACLWMQAGVVKKKECRLDFQCPSCRYDKALRKQCQENLDQADTNQTGLPATRHRSSKKRQLVFWKDKFRMQPLSRRPCIHHMKGQIDFKTCHKSYHCIDCEFDQYFQDQFKVYTMIEPVGYTDICGVNLPSGYYLHTGHTWLKIEDQNHVRIGLDDFASRLMGPPDKITPMLIGKTLDQGKQAFHVFKKGRKAVFPSPASGVITEINANLRKEPVLMNQAPYTDGWVIRLYCKNLRKELKELMFMDSAKAFMNHTVEDLYTFLEAETGLMAADGGSLGNDLYGNIPGPARERMLEQFIPLSI